MRHFAEAVDADLTGNRRRYDAEAQALLAGRCRVCSAVAWPRRSVCYRCGSSDVGEETFTGTGTLVTWTRVWVATGEVDPPYVLGMVDIGGLRLFAHVRGIANDLATPASVRLSVDGRAQPPFWFDAAEGTAEHAGAGPA